MELRGEGGFATLQNVVAAGLAMVFFAVLANLVVMQYTLGAVTAALDEGARQGARSLGPVAACQVRVEATLDAVTGRALEPATVASCRIEGEWIVAEIDGSLHGWAPLVPSLAFTREARAPIEDLAP
jgi:hypothetical protein